MSFCSAKLARNRKYVLRLDLNLLESAPRHRGGDPRFRLSRKSRRNLDAPRSHLLCAALRCEFGVCPNRQYRRHSRYSHGSIGRGRGWRRGRRHQWRDRNQDRHRNHRHRILCDPAAAAWGLYRHGYCARLRIYQAGARYRRRASNRDAESQVATGIGHSIRHRVEPANDAAGGRPETRRRRRE